MDKKYFILLIIATLITGCKKDQNNTVKTTGNTEMLVVKEVCLSNSNLDTLVTQTFTYDSQNRVISQLISYSGTDYTSNNYQYDQNGNLTQILIVEYNTIDNNVVINSTVSTIVYKNNIPSSRQDVSTEPGNYKYIKTYKYFNNGTNITAVLDSVANYYVYKYTYSGKNVQTQSYFSSSTDSIIYNYNYSDQKDPFYYSGYKWQIENIPFGGQDQAIEIKNSAQLNESFTGIIYNSPGYPTQYLMSGDLYKFTYISAK